MVLYVMIYVQGNIDNMFSHVIKPDVKPNC